MSTTVRGSRRNIPQRRQPASTPGPSSIPSQCRRGSPDPQQAEQHGQPNTTHKPDPHADQNNNKRKKFGNQTFPSQSSRSFLVAIDDANSDRGRKSKVKPRSHNRLLAENAATFDAEGSERDAHGGIDAHADYSGPLTAAEFAKLKREIDSWKKLAHENKKTIKKQSKAIEDFKQQDNTLRQKLKDSESQISKLQSKAKKLDEAVATVESNSQCQICMELLYRPYALSPCGHILCVTCLQEWFRKAPAVDDELYDNSDPDYLLHRRKTCPCCRTNIRHRPIPVFMIKSIVAAVAKAKGSQSGTSSSRDLSSNDSDPWEGLFPGEDDEIDDYGATDEEEDEDEDLDYEDEENSSWYDEVFGYGTGSDEETYQGEYVYPQWEPPSVTVDEDDYLFDRLDEGDFDCLRRGVTIGMLHRYDVEYRHNEGLLARDERYNHIYLGWTIRLSADDENGESYMQYLAEDMDLRPERWSIDEHDGGRFEARRLVPEEDVFDYQDTDSDNYMEVDLD